MMFLVMNAFEEVIDQNNEQLNKVIQTFKEVDADKNEVLRQLIAIKARNEVLGSFAYYLSIPADGEVIEGPAPETKDDTGPPDPVPDFVAITEDDNPDQEDKDVKKARLEDRGFFS